LITASSLYGDEPDIEHAKRRAALNWATEQAQQTFDQLLPRATNHDVVLPVCRVVTLRSGGLSDDTREFRIQIFELCDGTIRKAHVSVARIPFEVQLAQMRFQDDRLTLATALPRLLMDQHDLTSRDAQSILRSLDRVRLSPKPIQAFILDVVSVEVDVLSWGEILIHTYLEDDRPGWRDLAAALKRAMHLSKIDVDQLRFDPHEVEQ
jgi:hypothetical protein